MLDLIGYKGLEKILAAEKVKGVVHRYHSGLLT